MSAYFYFDVREVIDGAKLTEYRGKVFDTVAAHGGRYLALGGAVQALEGDRPPVLPVIIEFPDMASARGWYDSADYAPLLKLRREGARTEGVLIPGFAG